MNLKRTKFIFETSSNICYQRFSVEKVTNWMYRVIRYACITYEFSERIKKWTFKLNGHIRAQFTAFNTYTLTHTFRTYTKWMPMLIRAIYIAYKRTLERLRLHTNDLNSLFRKHSAPNLRKVQKMSCGLIWSWNLYL